MCRFECFKSRLDSVLKEGCCFSPSGKTSAVPPQPPHPERPGQRLTRLFFSCPLGPSAAERGPCGPDPQLEGRGVSQLPRRQHPRRRWVRGSAHPAPGPGRGGAGRSPPPAGPSFPAAPPTRAGRSHRRLQEAGSGILDRECGLGCVHGLGRRCR